MKLKRGNWEAGQKQRIEQRQRTALVARASERLRSAAVAAERLTQSPEWNSYLRQAQTLQDRDTAQLLEIQHSLTSGAALGDAELRSLHYRAGVLRAQLEARTELLNLPKEILSAAK